MKTQPKLEGNPLCHGYVNSYEGSDKEGKIHGDTRPVLFDCWVVISGTLGANSWRCCSSIKTKDMTLNYPQSFVTPAVLLRQPVSRMRLRYFPGHFYRFSEGLDTDMTVASHVIPRSTYVRYALHTYQA